MSSPGSRLRRTLQFAALGAIVLLPLALLPFAAAEFEPGPTIFACVGALAAAFFLKPAQPPTCRQVVLALAAGALSAVCLAWGIDRLGGLAVTMLGVFGVSKARDGLAVAGTLAAMAVAAAAMQIELPMADLGMRWMWILAIFCFLVGLCYRPAQASEAV